MLYQPYEKYHQKTRSQKKLIKKRNFTYRLILNALEPYLIDRKKILDIGCGAGTLSLYIASRSHYIRGIDISSKAIKACRASAQMLGVTQNVKFQIASFPEIIIKENFDLILCIEVLEHLIKDELAIEKMFNHLKTNGVIIISVPSIKAPLYKLGFAKKFDKQVGHLRRYDLNKIIKLLKEKKIKIIKAKKTEGIIRSFLFTSKRTTPIVRIANKFQFVSDILTFLDNISLKLFGASQIIIIAKKT